MPGLARQEFAQNNNRFLVVYTESQMAKNPFAKPGQSLNAKRATQGPAMKWEPPIDVPGSRHMTNAQVKAAGAPGGFKVNSGPIYGCAAKAALREGATALQAHQAGLKRLRQRRKEFFMRSATSKESFSPCCEMTAPRISLPLALDYSAKQMDSIQRGFKAPEMEVKWDFWFAKNVLHIHRSWTGNCIFQVNFVDAGEGRFHAVSVVASCDPQIWTIPTDAEVQSLVKTLIESFMFHGWKVPLSGEDWSVVSSA